MGMLAAKWLLAFACLLVALLSDGLLSATVSVALAVAALAGLAAVIMVTIIAWLPNYGLALYLRKIALAKWRAVALNRLRNLQFRLIALSAIAGLLALACLLVAIVGDAGLVPTVSAALVGAAFAGLLSCAACILFCWGPVHKAIGDLLRAESGRSGATSYLLNFASYAPLSDSPPPRSTH